MASIQNKDVAILSVHPQYAEALLAGSKKVEFRKRKFSADVKFVVIYASSPVQKIVGFFRIDEVKQGTPSEVWRQFQSVGGIKETDFWKYYQKSEIAIVILVKEAFSLQVPLLLSDLTANLSPPQSFIYISQQAFAEIKKAV